MRQKGQQLGLQVVLQKALQEQPVLRPWIALLRPGLTCPLPWLVWLQQQEVLLLAVNWRRPRQAGSACRVGSPWSFCPPALGRGEAHCHVHGHGHGHGMGLAQTQGGPSGPLRCRAGQLAALGGGAVQLDASGCHQGVGGSARSGVTGPPCQRSHPRWCAAAKAQSPLADTCTLCCTAMARPPKGR